MPKTKKDRDTPKEKSGHPKQSKTTIRAINGKKANIEERINSLNRILDKKDKKKTSTNYHLLKKLIEHRENLPKKYREKSLHLIPLQNKNKVPIKGVEFNAEPLTPDEAIEWMKKGGNIAVTGMPDDNWVNIDVDDERAIPIDSWKPTLTARSSKRWGYHLFYVCNNRKTKSGWKKEISNIDVPDIGEARTEKKYVLAPGSYARPSGQKLENVPENEYQNIGDYTIEKDLPIAEITYDELHTLYKEAHEKQEETLVKARRSLGFKSTKFRPGIDSQLYNLTAKDVMEWVAKQQPETYKDSVTTTDEGLTFTDRFPHPTHGSKQPPGKGNCGFLKNDELMYCFRDHTTHNAITILAMLSGAETCEELGSPQMGYAMQITDEQVDKAWEWAKEQGFIPTDDPMPTAVKKNRGLIREKEQGGTTDNYLALGREIMKTETFKTLRQGDDIYHYKDGFYQQGGQTIIKEKLQEMLQGKISTHLKNEVIAAIQDDTRIDNEEVFGEKNLHLLNLENGIYNTKTHELLPHTPGIVTTVRVPVKYNPEADCPGIKKFLTEILDPDDISSMQELIGYTLYRKYSIHKIAMFIGGGENGKGVLIELLTRMLGNDNVANIEPYALTKNNFATAAMMNKLANLHADITNRALENTGMLKMLTGDWITCDRKFKEPVTFRNYAKMIFSGNQLPETTDKTHAFFRRILVFFFPNTFTVEKGNRRDREEMIQEMTTEEELSGLFNYATEGLKRLLDRGHFEKNISTEETEKQYRRMSSSIDGFIMDCIIQANDENTFIPKRILYQFYCVYCELNGLTKVSQRVFSSKFPEFMPYASDSKRNVQTDETDSKGNPVVIRMESWNWIGLKSDIEEKYINKFKKVAKNMSVLSVLSVFFAYILVYQENIIHPISTTRIRSNLDMYDNKKEEETKNTGNTESIEKSRTIRTSQTLDLNTKIKEIHGVLQECMTKNNGGNGIKTDAIFQKLEEKGIYTKRPDFDTDIEQLLEKGLLIMPTDGRIMPGGK